MCYYEFEIIFYSCDVWGQWYALREIIFFKKKIEWKRKEGIIVCICLHEKKKNQRSVDISECMSLQPQFFSQGKEQRESILIF